MVWSLPKRATHRTFGPLLGASRALCGRNEKAQSLSELGIHLAKRVYEKFERPSALLLGFTSTGTRSKSDQASGRSKAVNKFPRAPCGEANGVGRDHEKRARMPRAPRGADPLAGCERVRKRPLDVFSRKARALGQRFTRLLATRDEGSAIRSAALAMACTTRSVLRAQPVSRIAHSNDHVLDRLGIHRASFFSLMKAPLRWRVSSRAASRRGAPAVQVFHRHRAARGRGLNRNGGIEIGEIVNSENANLTHTHRT